MTARVSGVPALKRLAVAIDGSEPSMRALEFALRIAAPFRSRFDLVAVVPTLPEFSAHPEVAQPLVNRLRTDAESHLARATERVVHDRLDAEPFLLEGYPAEQICSYTDQERPDLLVLGSRGLSDQRVHLIGSVSYNVAHFAKASVLVVRGDGGLCRILVPVDGSEPSARAVAWGAALARSQGARVTLLYVIPQETEEVKFTVSRGLGEPFLGPLMKDLASRGIPAERRVEYGRPAETIVHVAEDGEYDLGIVGVRGRGASPAFALGGVMDKVLHYAPCSTLVVR